MRCYLLEHPELHADFRKGDRQVLRDVWDFHEPQLEEFFGSGFITATGLRVPPLTKPDDIADALGDTYLRALSEDVRLKWDGKRPFGNLVAIIGRNALVSQHRKHGRELPSSGLDHYDDADITLAGGPVEQERSPVAPEAHAVLQKFFANQPERIRALVNARHVEDLTEQQTADLLGISRTRMNQLEDRMLEELRQLLHRAGIHSSADRLTPSPKKPAHG